MKIVKMVHPNDYGVTIGQRVARLKAYAARYAGKNAPRTKGQSEQLKRYQDELAFLESLQGNRK